MNDLVFLDKLRELDTSDNIVKWKDYANQLVFHTDNYYYKIYEIQDDHKFLSVIRHCIAEVYQDHGVDWKIQTFEKDGKFYDFEQREVIEVCPESMEFSNILKSFMLINSEIEERLGFRNLLSQLKLYNPEKFYKIARVKLVRDCVNKNIDYGRKNGQVYLLDDADFFLALIDGDSSWIPINNDFIPISLSYGEYTFTNADNTINSLEMEKMKENTMRWFLYNTNIADYVTRGSELLSKKDKEVQDNLRILDKDKNLKVYEETLMLENEDNLLYKNNVGRKSFQWELWQCCNSLCKFCYLGEENRHTDKERQLKSISDANKAIDSLDFNIYNNISFIGGEFFQGQLNDPDVNKGFYDLIKKVFKLYNDKKIGSMWLTVTLTIGDQKDLYKVLEIAREMKVFPKKEYGASGLWLCTSWDQEGRYHTEEMRKNWEYHMKKIYDEYSDVVKLNCTTIITGPLCRAYSEGTWDPGRFMDEYHTFLFFKQPGITGLQYELPEKYDNYDDYLHDLKNEMNEKYGFDFFPKRSDFLKFLRKFYNEHPNLFDRLFNINYRSDELHRNFNFDESDKECIRHKDTPGAEEENTPIMKCGHIINYAPYCDSNKCCICDRENSR